MLSYVSSANGASRLVWVNRQGQILGAAAPVSGILRDVRISPDGSRATVSRLNEASRVYDLMLLDLDRQTTSQLTYGGTAFQATWLRDQSTIVFVNNSSKGSALARMAPQEGAARIPVVPEGRDIVVFPYMILPLFVGREASIRSVEDALAKNRLLFLASQKEITEENPTPDTIYQVGTIAKIMRMRKLSDGRVKILIQGPHVPFFLSPESD